MTAGKQEVVSTVRAGEEEKEQAMETDSSPVRQPTPSSANLNKSPMSLTSLANTTTSASCVLQRVSPRTQQVPSAVTTSAGEWGIS